MRIVAGKWRGRRLVVPPSTVRPTADRVREAWMSIVHMMLPNATVLDLCAGSGALGIEALSRGARHATFVESSERVLTTLRENLAHVGAGELSTVVRDNAVAFIEPLAPGAYDIAFADPPYKGDVARSVAQRWLQSPFSGLLGVEHSANDTMPPGGETRRYGASAITFYRVADPPTPPAQPT
jgi:16S rRNA (guanine966-N2)-methyltransferase